MDIIWFVSETISHFHVHDLKDYVFVVCVKLQMRYTQFGITTSAHSMIKRLKN